MKLGIHGNPTPRAQQRQLPGGASRPMSGRSNRNPITGEDEPDRPVSRTADTSHSRPQSRPDGVPGLNLRYLADEDSKPSKPIDVYEYSLQTPNSASTVSWGTGRSQYSQRQMTKPPMQKSASRPIGVPGLSLEEQKEVKKPPSARKVQKEPSAWDGPAVSENVRPPSAHHQEMYKQYQDDMKQSYRKHVQAPYHVGQDEVERAVQAVKKAHPTSPKVNGQYIQVDDADDQDDNLDDSWTKQRYSGKQLMKKMDVEDLLEYNKKQKLIETVLADQLSRAVISDPEQNDRNKAYEPRRGRGQNRFLHDSKVSTRATPTENLLSKRVRFQARIITRNGHDALRELTGFFFHVDNTMTIYEFKQFGKSAKAIPFINRGHFLHLRGARKDQPYTLLDIYSGGNLLISTSGQMTIPASMKGNEFIKFRVISVDEDEKSVLLDSTRGQETFARLQYPTKQEYENQKILESLQDVVGEKLKKRGIKTVTGLGRWYRKLDTDSSGLLTHHELEQGLVKYRLELPQQILDAVIEILDPDNEGRVDYSDYMHAIIGEMNEYRKSLVIKAFRKIDSSKRGLIVLSDIRKFFNATASARGPPDATGTSVIQAFLESVMASPKQEEVSYVEFEEYYEGLSIGFDSEEDFANILRNTWTI
ncbi:calcyphosin-2-like [Haliotis rufescens]|uniref:calcyphosin-2-like n=1 Tax=Haliotis rufescens TaxID=6454 RepID=UPI00201F0B77|nr:calcyphosin-2-like [Haliotis rufescens]XP_046346155.2 calcyphosin-2-like [Haliotis rufescens]